MATTLYLLRHAESAPDRSIPADDWPLSELGRQQALDLVPRLQRLAIEAIYSSPLPRTLDTVRPFASQAGLPVRIRQNLRDSKMPGVSPSDVRGMIREMWRDFGFAPPGGEPNAAYQRRVLAVVQPLLRRHQDSTLLAVSHGNAIALYLNWVDPAFGFDQWAAIRNPDVLKVTVSGGEHVWDADWVLPGA